MNDLPQALACSMQFRKLIEREMESITETYHLRMMDIIVLYHLDLEERDPDNTGRSMEKELLHPLPYLPVSEPSPPRRVHHGRAGRERPEAHAQPPDRKIKAGDP